jgi:tetrapyrrole methylase family protein/MazG family protein
MADSKKWQELIDIIARLRAKDGCPWDREQTHQSIKYGLIEESYEVIDAIDSEDEAALCDELGDVLLQVVFHAQIAAEENRFTINDVVKAITQKMIRRHPHIFGEAHAENTDEVLTMWEQIKAEEKDASQEKRGIMKLNENLPALMLAQKAQDKAHRIGFDWQDISGARAKLTEEIGEFDAAETVQEKAEELGDIFFSLVNLARFLDIKAEDALRQSVRKFIRRFEYMEKAIDMAGKVWSDMDLQQMDHYWNQAKERE